jgi:16S rRNA (cytosine967-C5)-methyltransferase
MLRLAERDPALAGLFDGSSHGPAPVAPGEQAAQDGIAPDWLTQALAVSGVAADEAQALLDRAPLDLRVNTLKSYDEEINLLPGGDETIIPNAHRFPSGTPVEQWEEYKEGLVEIQDLGSQVACLAVEARPGEIVIDFCAGAGGKTLSLAAAMDNRGTLLACDTDKRRLGNLLPRAARAGAGMIETMLLDPGKELAAMSAWHGKADAVLVDAPCSGTGTWRRNPEARWRLSPESVARYARVQDDLLDIAARLVRPGSRLIFVTCSLLDAEGSERAAAFLSRNPGWRTDRPDLPLGRPRGEGTRLTPFHDGTDGFFIARFVSPC